MCFSSVVVRREVFSHVGRFDPLWDLSIDYDLWLRVARFYQFDFVDEALVRYRTGHGNLSKKLRDRVDTAMSIMHRAETRYGAGADIAPEVIADGYASTCHTIGYTMRPSEPRTAVRWYLRALAWPVAFVAMWSGIAWAAKGISLRRRKPAGPRVEQLEDSLPGNVAPPPGEAERVSTEEATREGEAVPGDASAARDRVA